MEKQRPHFLWVSESSGKNVMNEEVPSSLQSFSDDYLGSLHEAPATGISLCLKHMSTLQIILNPMTFSFVLHSIYLFFFLRVKSSMIHDSYKHILVNSIMDDASWPHIFVFLWRETYNLCNYSDSV